MFDYFFEWLASRSDPRFRAYREARLLYEACVREFDIQFCELPSGHHKIAAQDERLQRSEKLYRQAIELSREANAIEDTATGLYQLGMLLHLENRFEEASQSLHDSLLILEDIPRPEKTTISGCYYHLGLIALFQGRMGEARHYISQSLEIDTNIGYLPGISLCMLALAKCGDAGMADKASGKECIINELNDNGTDRDTAHRSNTDRKKTAATQPIYGTSNDAPDTAVDTPLNSATRPRKANRQYRPHVAAEKGIHEQDEMFQVSSSFVNDVVWLLSYSKAANNQFIGSLEQLAGHLPRELIVAHVSFDSQVEGKSTPPPLALNERLCGAILILENEGLKNENFRYWLSWCIQNAASMDDFRLFVCLHDMTPDEIGKYAKKDQLLATLLDTVQLLVPSTSEHLCDTFSMYLRKLDDIRAAALWRKVRIGATLALGRIAGTIQVFCGAVLGIVALAVFILGSESAVARLAYVNNSLVVVIVGVVLFPLLQTPLFLLFQGIGKANSFIRNSLRIRIWLIFCALLTPSAIGLLIWASAQSSWIALGVAIGVLLDITRRMGCQAQRTDLSLKRALEVSDQSLSAEIAKAMIKSVEDPLRYPLTPTIAPKIFISYTLWSDWSKIYASKLHNMLCGIGVDSFLDQSEIGEGSSWRSHLNRSINEASVFIAVLDETAVTRKWVAAEMITALASRQLTGLPTIIVLKDSQLSLSSNMLPVFRAVLQECYAMTQIDEIRIIAAKDSTLRTLMLGLHPNHYRTPSILPSRLTALLSLLTIPGATIGSIGLIFGLTAALFAYLQHWGKVDSSTILSSWGILTIVYLIFGYWLGFTARLGVASRFEVRHTATTPLAWLHVLSCIGFVGILAVWYADVPNLIIGWAVALCWIGWMIANSFIGHIKQEKPGAGRT